MRSLLGDPREISEMSLGPPSAGHDGVPSETSFAFANLTVEPASRNGMSATAQAVGASARTRLGHGPRAKAHVDYGAWSRGRLDGSRDTRKRASDIRASQTSGRRDTSQSRGATTSLKTPYGVRLDAHNRLDAFGYGTANVDGTDHDKSVFVNGSLVSDLLTSLEALGGARPHPAATLINASRLTKTRTARRDVEFVPGTSLCGAAMLRDTHGMDARSILDAFQEATYLISAWVVPRLAAPARAAGAPSRRAGRSRRRGAAADPAEARTGDRFCGGRARYRRADPWAGPREAPGRRASRSPACATRRGGDGGTERVRQGRRRRRRRRRINATRRAATRRMVCSHTISRVSAWTTATPPGMVILGRAPRARS